MERAPLHTLPARDPITGGPLVITEMEAVDGGVTIRGRFEVPRFARLSPDQARYLETFLRCRGMLNSVERELGISYPTARARLDAVLKALDLNAVREEAPPVGAPSPASISPLGEEPESELGIDAFVSEDSTLPPQNGADWDEPMEQEEEFATPVEETPIESAEPEEPPISRSEILSLLERGEITVEEAKRKLGAAR